jgi:hypothetical protein
VKFEPPGTGDGSGLKDVPPYLGARPGSWESWGERCGRPRRKDSAPNWLCGHEPDWIDYRQYGIVLVVEAQRATRTVCLLA